MEPSDSPARASATTIDDVVIPYTPGYETQDPKKRRLLTRGDSLLVTFGFRCNLACTFCLVEDGLDNFTGISLEQFESWLQFPELFEGVERVILSGGEATLEADLFGYIEKARRVPGVKNIRIQTNGMRLANKEYLQRLIDAGVTECFVSFHAHDEPLNHLITQRKGAFRTILAGCEAVAKSSASLMTNTAIVTQNHQHLREIVEVLAPLRPDAINFWYMHLRVDGADKRAMQPRMADVEPRLMEALDRADALSLKALVKWIPRCVLGRHGDKQDNSQPTTLVEPVFWETAPHFACIYRGACELGNECSGLTFPYIETHGYEEGYLRPKTKQGAVKASSNNATPLQLSREERTRAEELMTKLGIVVGAPWFGWEVAAPTRMADVMRIPISGGGAAGWIELGPVRDERCYFRSKSFLLAYGRIEAEHEGRLGPALAALKKKLVAIDDGHLSLPWWRSA